MKKYFFAFLVLLGMTSLGYSQTTQNQNLASATQSFTAGSTNNIPLTQEVSKSLSVDASVVNTSAIKTKSFWKILVGIVGVIALFVVYWKKRGKLDLQDIGAILLVVIFAVGFLLFEFNLLSLEKIYKFFN